MTDFYMKCNTGLKWVNGMRFSGAYSKSSQVSKMEYVAKIVNGLKSLDIFVKTSVLDL